ncbi:MAG: hypothetical protein ACPGRX_01760, partial [Bdellovibrionales bacterium]
MSVLSNGVVVAQDLGGITLDKLENVFLQQLSKRDPSDITLKLSGFVDPDSKIYKNFRGALLKNPLVSEVVLFRVASKVPRSAGGLVSRFFFSSRPSSMLREGRYRIDWGDVLAFPGRVINPRRYGLLAAGFYSLAVGI